MKNAIYTIAAAAVLLAAPCHAQGLRQGNLFGVHVMAVTLKPGATMADFKAFFVRRVLPEYENAWVGLHGYLVQSVRGESKNRLAVMWLFESEAARDRYFDADGKANALEKAALQKVQPIEEALKEVGTYTLEYKDDWLVQ